MFGIIQLRLTPVNHQAARNRITSFVLVALSMLATTSSVAEGGTLSLTNQPETSGWATLQYTPETGQLRAVSPNPPMSTLEIISSRQLFVPERIPAGLILPPFDVASNDKLFLLKTAGIHVANFGNVLPTGLTAGELLADFQVTGSYLTDGLSFAKVYIVPEPTGATVMMLVPSFTLSGVRRVRNRHTIRAGGK